MELQMNIVQSFTNHADLICLMENCPGLVQEIWQKYPNQLFQRAWDNLLKGIDDDLVGDAIMVYHIRKIRKDYATAMRSTQRAERQYDRVWLENDLRAILSLDDEPTPELETKLETVLDMAEIIHDVNLLTNRYSNDAWKRVHGIAQETGTAPSKAPGAIRLTRVEGFKFRQAFLRVEIYLLTKYWTNAQDQRHTLDMHEDIETYIPMGHGFFCPERRRFDSCLRYIFHAYRRHLKNTARELGVSELPTRDDFAWVRNWDENDDYEYEDYPTTETEDPLVNLKQRSISEEQAFLLFLCESGIGPLRRMHQAKDSARRSEILQQFGRRHVWETVELPHRFSRYDECVAHPYPNNSPYASRRRNRHPVMSLYREDAHQRYVDDAAPWACAYNFLQWKLNLFTAAIIWNRENIALNANGRWIMMGDTDSAHGHWIPFRLRGREDGPIRPSHPYMLTRERYEMCSHLEYWWRH